MAKRSFIIYSLILFLVASMLGNVLLYLAIQQNKQQNTQSLQAINEDMKKIEVELAQTKAMMVKSTADDGALIQEDNQIQIYLNEMINEIQVKSLQDTSSIYAIIDALPQVTKKVAFIKEIGKHEGKYNLVLDYVEWFSGEAAIQAAAEDQNPEAASLSNGFYIRNTIEEQDKVQLSADSMFFVLDGAGSIGAAIDDFIQMTPVDRLFNIRFVNDSIVLLEERYRP